MQEFLKIDFLFVVTQHKQPQITQRVFEVIAPKKYST